MLQKYLGYKDAARDLLKNERELGVSQQGWHTKIYKQYLIIAKI